MKSGHENKKNRAPRTGKVAPRSRSTPRGASARTAKATPEPQPGLRKKAGALEAEMRRRRDLEVELQDHMAELTESDRRKDEFLATLAHELRNPLAPIKMAAMLARSNCTCAGSHRYLDMIERQADNLTRIVDDLIEISRLTHGKLTLKRERIALATIVNRAVDSARAYLEQRHHRVSVTLPDEAILVMADPVRLEQALVNVLVNAAKYTPPEGHIDIAVQRDGNEAVVRVRDDGVGIPPLDLDRVFDLFRQMPDRRPDAQGGLGIGLTMARAIVEMHGGSILASSEGPGAGSEFVIRLSLASDVAETSDTARASAAETSAMPHHRVLIVDDNTDAGEALRELLVSGGHEVRLVQDGRSALRAVREFKPSVVLLDLAMPRMDGYEVAKRIRESHPKVRLIAVTGYSLPHHYRRAAEAGITDLLVKPVRVDVLARALRGAPSAPSAPNAPDVTRAKGSSPSKLRRGLTSRVLPA